jgi:hypothetical protein
MIAQNLYSRKVCHSFFKNKISLLSLNRKQAPDNSQPLLFFGFFFGLRIDKAGRPTGQNGLA